MSLTSEDKARRLAAKRFNERVKLVVVTVNAMALTTLGAALILPALNPALPRTSSFWILLAVGLHLIAQALFQLLRSEE